MFLSWLAKSRADAFPHRLTKLDFCHPPGIGHGANVLGDLPEQLQGQNQRLMLVTRLRITLAHRFDNARFNGLDSLNEQRVFHQLTRGFPALRFFRQLGPLVHSLPHKCRQNQNFLFVALFFEILQFLDSAD